jgi:hypothetical protein
MQNNPNFALFLSLLRLRLLEHHLAHFIGKGG